MADISGVSFGQTVDLLGNAIQGANREQEQIANNIANVNTPNFRRGTTSFKEALAATLGIPADPDELAMATNGDRQFAINDAVPPQPFVISPHTDDLTQMRVDHSNVDPDQEMGLLQENSGYEQTMSALLQKQYAWLREATTEQAQ